MAKRGPFGVLDIGTDKTVCLIARMDGTQAKVMGVGHVKSRGLKAGAVIDMDACEQSILQAVGAAEAQAGETLRSVIVSLSGGNPFSRTSVHDIDIGGREVTDADTRRVVQESRRRLGAAPGGHGLGPATGVMGDPASRSTERYVIHTIPVAFTVDGSRGIRDPREMVAQRLGVHVHVVTASSSALRNLSACIARCHLDIQDVVASPYAAGLAALDPDQRNLGHVLVDMGGGTTTIAVFSQGQPIHIDCVPIGGNHVTSDIARGLSTSLAHAERIKTLYGAALAADADERELIDVPVIGEDHTVQPNHVPKSILTGIIQPRLEETFELVRAKLEQSNFDHQTWNNVVLTGGAAQLHSVRDLARHILDRNVRIGRPQGLAALPKDLSGPAFATVAGLIDFAQLPSAELLRLGRAKPDAKRSLIGRFGLWFRENF
ncbi:MAG: cell division protein FtsA [Alphaproteobacteria bacterium]|nr:MAG: cell division protein FtsA [Alphaproteobacteria bacterium]